MCLHVIERVVVGIVALALVCAIYVLAGVVSWSNDQPASEYTMQPMVASPPEVEHVQNSPHGDEPSAQFISECSGMDLTQPDVYLYAVTECIGRMRGFVDGHNLMVAMVAEAMGNRGAETIQMFCISPNVKPDKLVAGVMNWADAHKEEYGQLVSVGHQNAATIIMIKALNADYPCANT